jgi:hypothetical protein
MPEYPLDRDQPEHRYDETVDPSNPPNAVLRPAVRRKALGGSLGIILVLCVAVAAAAAIWITADLSPDGDDRIDPSAVGTSGERQPRENTPGGFDPAPRPRSLEDELERRGVDERPQGPMPGLRGLRGDSAGTAGRQIELENVMVERADGGTFWIRDGNETATVVTSGGMPTVRAGQRVDVTGTVEQSGTDVRIRASRIDVK